MSSYKFGYKQDNYIVITFITYIRGLRTRLITTHEPPGKPCAVQVQALGAKEPRVYPSLHSRDAFWSCLL